MNGNEPEWATAPAVRDASSTRHRWISTDDGSTGGRFGERDGDSPEPIHAALRSRA